MVSDTIKILTQNALLYLEWEQNALKNILLLFSKFYIADATENETMIAINHIGTANLYISNREGATYSLSLENVLYYNNDAGKRK